jgi:hypothetical protein
MREILDAWFSTKTDAGEAASEWNRQQVGRVDLIGKN